MRLTKEFVVKSHIPLTLRTVERSTISGHRFGLYVIEQTFSFELSPVEGPSASQGSL